MPEAVSDSLHDMWHPELLQTPSQQRDMWHPGPFQTPSRDAELRPQTFYSPLGGPELPATFAALGNHETSALPRAVPIKPRATANHLPSCSIDKSSLMPPEDVVRKYPKLKGESKAGKLAVKLAKEAFFGDKILIQCTVSGCRDLPALPMQELTEADDPNAISQVLELAARV